jgi:PhnB protein
MPSPIPSGFRSVTPYLVVSDAAKVMDFLQHAFGATERFKMQGPDGSISHAEIQVGDSVVMLGQSPDQTRTTHAMLYLYVPDVDAVYEKAVAAGGISLREPTDQFYGDRSGAVKDPGGNEWWIATHKEDVSPQEMERRMASQRASA